MVNKFNQCLKQTNKQNKQSKTKTKPKTTQAKTNEKNTCELKSLITKKHAYWLLSIIYKQRGCRGRYRMVVGFTTTSAICDY
jgi:hypothetical protein